MAAQLVTVVAHFHRKEYDKDGRLEILLPHLPPDILLLSVKALSGKRYACLHPGRPREWQVMTKKKGR